MVEYIRLEAFMANQCYKILSGVTARPKTNVLETTSSVSIIRVDVRNDQNSPLFISVRPFPG
jgi:hypothetical protein